MEEEKTKENVISEEEIRKISKFIIEDLKKEKIFKSNKKDSFEKTEYLLYKYNQLPDAIKFLKDEIKKIENESADIPKSSIKSSKLVLKDETQSYVYGDEILESRIFELKQLVVKTRSYKRMVDKAMKIIESDEYYPIVEYIYFKNKTYDEIANEFGWSIGTISKHKSRLINVIKVYLFPESFLNEIGV